MKPFYLAIYCLLCCVPMLAYAQPNPDSSKAVSFSATNFPSHFFDKITSRTASLKRQLSDQTARYLRRMAKEESRLQKNLYALDTGKAAALYAQNPQQRYALLAQKLRQDSSRLFSSMGPEYLPYADSMQGVLAYLNAHPALLNANPALLSRMQTSLAGLQQLQVKLQMADQIKAFIQSRKTQIEQALSGYSHLPSGVTGALDGYKKQAFYYADQVRAFRTMLNDPDKTMRTALTLLNNLPAFTAFVKQNSFLAGLIGVPAGYEESDGMATSGASGKSLTAVSASLTANWIVQNEKPTEDELNNFLTGHSVNMGAGIYGGFSTTYSPSTGSIAIGVGLFTPQIGVSYNYQPETWVMNTNIKW